jgi:hypothetical protein
MWQKLGNAGNKGFSLALAGSKHIHIAKHWSNIGANARRNLAVTWF